MASARLRRPLLAALLLAVLPGAAPITDLSVTLANVRSDRGVLRLCVTSDPDNFPNCTDDARAVTRTVAASVRTVRFEGLPSGDYAVAVIHDENDNARLDRFAGIPREGFGFSRNPPLGFGPPRFSAARFPVDGDAAMQQVRLRYLL
ncbi:DUF2141 domain-containing protein [Hephaestia sp. CMS5P-6]|nr:DUF2141 domain-containing protein [Hephaestia mangrovi]